jgi:hypothetical protein
MPCKKPGCWHQYASEPNCQPAFLNSYHCDDCDVSWTDEWSCGCDDECPECGAAIAPEESEKIDECACEYL